MPYYKALLRPVVLSGSIPESIKALVAIALDE